MTEFLMKPRVDYAFKEIMMDEKARIGFLSAMLKLNPEEIKETQMLNTNLRKQSEKEKLGILDVRILMNNNTEIDIPEEMIETQIENMLRDFDMQMRYQGIDLQQYMQYTGTTLDNLKEQFKEDAAKRVKMSLVLEKIAKVENIEVTEKDIEKEYKTICDQNGMKLEDVKKYVNEHDVKDRLQSEKTVKFCVDNAVVK